MQNAQKYSMDVRINWYRTPIEKTTLQALLRRSDLQGFKQAGGQLALWCMTGTLAFLAYRNITTSNAYWSVPVLLAALFAHGTIGSFFGGTACHELGHGTPFKTKAFNDVFLRIYAFLGWWDHVWFRPSHQRHHQVTVHHDYDGEVVLPQQMSLKDWRFWLGLFAWYPLNTWNAFKVYFRHATGRMDNEWFEFVLPSENVALRRRHRDWARFTLAAHALLALVFILSGNWILVFIVNISSHYCGWLGFMTGFPQHYGLTPDVPDHRLCCRTFTCGRIPSFLYWNMHYHIEHHMFPAVPFFNLPKIHQLIKADLPPTPRGLIATWKEMLVIHRRMATQPDYCYTPPLPTAPAADGISVPS